MISVVHDKLSGACNVTCLSQIRVSDLVGKSLGKLTVIADTARHLGDDAVVLSKKPLTVSSADP